MAEKLWLESLRRRRAWQWQVWPGRCGRSKGPKAVQNGAREASNTLAAGSRGKQAAKGAGLVSLSVCRRCVHMPDGAHGDAAEPCEARCCCSTVWPQAGVGCARRAVPATGVAAGGRSGAREATVTALLVLAPGHCGTRGKVSWRWEDVRRMTACIASNGVVRAGHGGVSWVSKHHVGVLNLQSRSGNAVDWRTDDLEMLLRRASNFRDYDVN